jgi:hypothetical protein
MLNFLGILRNEDIRKIREFQISDLGISFETMLN